eukprot:9007842-Alexandrium_andersonii.AAC.1
MTGGAGILAPPLGRPTPRPVPVPPLGPPNSPRIARSCLFPRLGRGSSLGPTGRRRSAGRADACPPVEDDG